MGKCYIDKKHMIIDIFYNDLYALEKKIKYTKINCYMNKTSSSLNKSMKRIIILHIFVYLWLSIMCLINNLFTFTSYTFKKG